MSRLPIALDKRHYLRLRWSRVRLLLRSFALRARAHLPLRAARFLRSSSLITPLSSARAKKKNNREMSGFLLMLNFYLLSIIIEIKFARVKIPLFFYYIFTSL